METRYFRYNELGEPFEVPETALEEGDGEPIAIVTQENRAWKIEVDQYYCRDGLLRLEITQPLDRALRTFRMLLEADTELETNDIQEFSPERMS